MIPDDVDRLTMADFEQLCTSIDALSEKGT
jgi:hypothetical protein